MSLGAASETNLTVDDGLTCKVNVILTCRANNSIACVYFDQANMSLQSINYRTQWWKTSTTFSSGQMKLHLTEFTLYASESTQNKYQMSDAISMEFN